MGKALNLVILELAKVQGQYILELVRPSLDEGLIQSSEKRAVVEWMTVWVQTYESLKWKEDTRDTSNDQSLQYTTLEGCKKSRVMDLESKGGEASRLVERMKKKN